MVSRIRIALDGPAGSGKSTVAKGVAHKLNYIYIDTGAMYRAVTLKALENNIPVDDAEKLTRMMEDTEIVLRYERHGNESVMHVFLDGRDVSEAIRGLEVTANVSPVAAVAGVRQALVSMQRKMAEQGGVVMDGRDIGTVVLPQAELKVFLTASVAERGRRRWLELREKQMEVDLAEIIAQIEKRDDYDSHREVDPLRQADDAILVDTTEMSKEEVIDYIVKLALERGARIEPSSVDA